MHATWINSVFVATSMERKLPLNSQHKWSLFLAGEVRHMGPPHITHLRPWPLSNAFPIPVRACHIWLPRPRTLSFPPFSKCTSGSHLTPVRPNFHFQGRCGFQIIYHFPKCFHMCVGFPSVQSFCLRPTFSKCIKIQFAPKKFRHWCFIVVMSGNY